MYGSNCYTRTKPLFKISKLSNKIQEMTVLFRIMKNIQNVVNISFRTKIPQFLPQSVDPHRSWPLVHAAEITWHLHAVGFYLWMIKTIIYLQRTFDTRGNSEQQWTWQTWFYWVFLVCYWTCWIHRNKFGFSGSPMYTMLQ